jgi:polyphosphate kinase 2 (PPK2 family)
MITAWWFEPSEKYEFVSWDDYSQYMAKMFQTTNQ